MHVESSGGRFCGGEGYALASVLFLVAVLSILCAIVLKMELSERKDILNAMDKIKSQSASDNGIVLALASLQYQPTTNSIFSMSFNDGSTVEVEVYPWGLFTGVRSVGESHESKSIRSALLASSVTESEGSALVLGNLQHGLVFTGNAQIIGDVALGPMGVSTGSLRNYSAPRSIPITGKKTTLSASQLSCDTVTLYHHVMLTGALIDRVYRSPTNQDNSSDEIECTGSLNLHQVNDSVEYVFCSGSLSLMDTIMRRGPPLYVVAQGAVSFCPDAFLSGPISICSKDSIVVPPSVFITNCILTSERSILFQSNASIQLFSPRIHFSSNAVARYPSIAASVSFTDISGAAQSIQLDDGSRVEGAVIMHRANEVSMDNAVITLSPGATVVGGIYTDAYLTMDGTVDGYVRTFDLYFYDSPTTYLGWLRQGVIDRALLPYGLLKPLGMSGADTMRVLSWM
jgi:hypothetical protein